MEASSKKPHPTFTNPLKIGLWGTSQKSYLIFRWYGLNSPTTHLKNKIRILSINLKQPYGVRYMSNLTINSLEKYNACKANNATTEGQFSKYQDNLFLLSIDEVGEVFQQRYDGRWIIFYTYEILLYKLFEKDNYELYFKICDMYDCELKQSSMDVDSIYSISINMLKLIL